MPVTAKLSKAFYEALGDQMATELVEWFNMVDATYRADLRELNELNFARSDAKVEQRFAQSEIKFAQFETKMEQRFARFEAKVEQRLTQFEAKIEARIGRFEVRMEERCARLEARFAQLEVRMERRFGEQTRWFIAAWAVMLAAVMGLYIRR